MRVLAFDTAGPVLGVALRCDGDTFIRTERCARGAETRLMPWATSLCAAAGFSLRDVDGVTTTLGPGAFTGVRVGIATAIGVAMSVECPFWACGSLDTRAARGNASSVLALLDARKGRFYGAWFAAGERRFGPADETMDVLLGARDPGTFVATGEGAVLARDRIEAEGGLVAPEADHPAVDVLARLAAEAFSRGEAMDPLSVRPLYVRDADAKRPEVR